MVAWPGCGTSGVFVLAGKFVRTLPDSLGASAEWLLVEA